MTSDTREKIAEILCEIAAEANPDLWLGTQSEAVLKAADRILKEIHAGDERVGWTWMTMGGRQFCANPLNAPKHAKATFVASSTPTTEDAQ